MGSSHRQLLVAASMMLSSWIGSQAVSSSRTCPVRRLNAVSESGCVPVRLDQYTPALTLLQKNTFIDNVSIVSAPIPHFCGNACIITTDGHESPLEFPGPLSSNIYSADRASVMVAIGCMACLAALQPTIVEHQHVEPTHSVQSRCPPCTGISTSALHWRKI